MAIVIMSFICASYDRWTTTRNERRELFKGNIITVTSNRVRTMRYSHFFGYPKSRTCVSVKIPLIRLKTKSFRCVFNLTNILIHVFIYGTHEIIQVATRRFFQKHMIKRVEIQTTTQSKGLFFEFLEEIDFPRQEIR